MAKDEARGHRRDESGGIVSFRPTQRLRAMVLPLLRAVGSPLLVGWRRRHRC